MNSTLLSIRFRKPASKCSAISCWFIGATPPSPEIEHARQLTHEYKKMVERRFRETRKPGTISTLIGGGNVFPREGKAYGNHAFHYWDDRALVHQTLRVFEGQELEAMERISLSDDRTMLVYEQELSSGGLTKKHEERFPFRYQRTDQE